MPQLDLFTLLFQFKSFFIVFFSIYFLFVFVFVPRLHFIISSRRLQVLSLVSYFNFLRFVVYFSFSSQCSILKSNLLYFNTIYSSFYYNYLQCKFGVSNFLFLNINN